MTETAIERLTVRDSAQNVALSRSVGWVDVEGEWLVLHAAATVLGVREADRLIAQGALGDYGSAATVAKMVVAPDRQGAGWGRRVLEELMAPVRARGSGLGLCATEQGRPLYEKAGFHASGEIVILVGEAVTSARPGSTVPLTEASEAVEIERRFMACDRSRMLGARLAASSVAVQLTGGAGFALATPGEGLTVLGPVIAENEAAARELLLGIVSQLAGRLRLDVAREHAGLRAWLIGLGLREMSVRTEMACGVERAPWQVPERFALASQAWG